MNIKLEYLLIKLAIILEKNSFSSLTFTIQKKRKGCLTRKFLLRILPLNDSIKIKKEKLIVSVQKEKIDTS